MTRIKILNFISISSEILIKIIVYAVSNTARSFLVAWNTIKNVKRIYEIVSKRKLKETSAFAS